VKLAGIQSKTVDPEALVIALRDTSRALQQFLAFQARANGLGLPELLTLARAADAGGVAPNEAGAALGLRSSTMTMLCNRLERDGLIRRVPHPKGRPLVLLKATPAGRKLIEDVRRPIFASLAELVLAASPEQHQFLDQFLDQLVALLVKHAGPSPTSGRTLGRRRTPTRTK